MSDVISQQANGSSKVFFGFGGHRYLIAIGSLTVLHVTVVVVFIAFVLSKQRHARAVFGGARDPHAKYEIDQCMAASLTRPWFASLSCAQLRYHLNEYFRLFANRGPLGDAISMQHFLEYVLKLERAKGAGDLSETTRRCTPPHAAPAHATR